MPSKDAIAVLIADHRKVDELFSEFGGLGERAVKSKEEICRKVCQELTVHAQIEEEVFYPRIREEAEKVNDEVLESLEEHHLIKILVGELNDLGPGDEAFDAKMQVLQEQVEHHVKEEEKEMFPAVRKLLSEEVLDELGQALVDAKKEAKEKLPVG
jgi:hemerythrin superfamily protein